MAAVAAVVAEESGEIVVVKVAGLAEGAVVYDVSDCCITFVHSDGAMMSLLAADRMMNIRTEGCRGGLGDVSGSGLSAVAMLDVRRSGS